MFSVFCKVRFALIGFWPVVPRREPISIVFGSPIECTSDSDVEITHELFIDAIKKLFDEHKVRHGWSKDKQLEVV